MAIVAIGGNKGGTGKTTMAITLAVGLKGDLLDLDQQRACAAWNRIRGAVGGKALKVMEAQEPAEVDQLLAPYKDSKDMLVIDCGGFDSHANRAALAAADLVITPCKPSAPDMIALQRFQVVLGQLNRVGYVLTAGVLPQSQGIIKELGDYIKEKLPRLGMLKTIIRYRMDYQYTYEQGKTALELADGHPAKGESGHLIQEVKRLLADKRK